LTRSVSRLASLFVLALALGSAPALAAATAAAPSADSQPAAPAPDTTNPGAGDDQGDTGGGPVVEAPVPDPFLAEVLKACQDGASGDKGTFQRLQDDGWNLSVDGDTQTPFYQAFNGEKDFDGVGTVDITYSLEVYPSMTEGYCSLSIDSAERKIGIADLAKVPGLKGQLKNTNDGVASTWEDTSADPPTYIQADQHAKDLYFLLDVTKLMKRPLAELPFVQPEDSTDPGATDDGSDAGN
jgi:hypothetical protein